jgi:putative membrane protein
MSVTSEDLSALTDASAKILDGLTQLVAGAEALEANVSFEALKRIMAENGLDVDVLKSNNSTAMGLLRQSIDENKEFAEVLKALEEY